MHPALEVPRETFRMQMRYASTLNQWQVGQWIKDTEEPLAAKVQMKLLERPQGWPLSMLARHKYLIPSAQKELVKRQVQDVHISLARNPMLVEEVYQQLKDSHWVDVQIALMGSPFSDATYRSELFAQVIRSRSKQVKVAQELARISMSEKEYIQHYKSASSVYLQSQLLVSKSTPESVIRAVLKKGDKDSLEMLALNPTLKEHHKRVLAEKGSVLALSRIFMNMEQTAQSVKWLLGQRPGRETEMAMSLIMNLNKPLGREATEEFVNNLTVEGEELGANFTDALMAGVWSSVAAKLARYGDGLPQEFIESIIDGRHGREVILALGRNESLEPQTYWKIYREHGKDRRVLGVLAATKGAPQDLQSALSYLHSPLAGATARAHWKLDDTFAAHYVRAAAGRGDPTALAMLEKARREVRRDCLDVLMQSWEGSWGDLVKAADLLDQ